MTVIKQEGGSSQQEPTPNAAQLAQALGYVFARVQSLEGNTAEVHSQIGQALAASQAPARPATQADVNAMLQPRSSSGGAAAAAEEDPGRLIRGLCID